jgi:Na+-transporting methylmalonyl-CoA/oxaloacetate decarboxylase gamma subunit
VDVFFEAIKIMVQGMTGIFLAISLFYIIIKLMVRIFPEEK